MTAVIPPTPSSSTEAPEVQTWELWWLAALVGLYLADGVFPLSGFLLDINLVGPLWLAAVLAAGAVEAVRHQPAALWTALFWMRLSTAVYFGIGSVADRVMNAATLGELHDFFAASPAEIAAFNLLAAVCSLAILATAACASVLYPAPVQKRVTPDERMMGLAGLLFALPGFATKYLLIFPHSMGAFGEDVILPGVLTQLVWLAPVATFLLLSWSLRNAKAWLFLLVPLVLLDSFAGVLRFSKAEALLPLLMLTLALLQHRWTFRRAAVAVAVAVAVFPLLQSVTSAGRAELADRYNTIRSASFPERLDILADIVAHGPPERHADLQGGLIRIAYVHAAAPAMAMFDAGQPGNSLSYIPLVAVPRLLWPEKPLFDMGRDYTQMLTGFDTSSTWMGYFAEAYWNLGWLGVPLVMIPLGLIFFATGRYTLWTLANGQWLHFPAVFLGMYSGARTDGLIAGDVVASTLTILLVYPAAQLATPVLQALLGPPRAAPARIWR